MGLFGKKPLYQYAPLERYRINIEKAVASSLANNTQSGGKEPTDFCRLIGETSKYNLYLYREKASGSGKFFLRQEKNSPKTVVYLGKSNDYYAFLNNRLFSIDGTANKIGYLHPKLQLVDVETARRSEIDILSGKTTCLFIAGMVYEMTQDFVRSMTATANEVVFEITRYPEGMCERLTDNTAVKYQLHLWQDNNEFKIKRIFPEGKEPTPQVPWRDKSGKVACPGDRCVSACDKNCPIWLNTMGLSMLKIKAYDKAVQAFSDALSLAPDFLDVQNNLGTAYGLNNQHQEAYHAFKKAHEMKKDYPKALHGLIVAETNLGLTEDALQHCDEYDKLHGCDSKHLRETLTQSEHSKEFIPNAVAIADILMDYGRTKGYILSEESTFPHIPEILALSSTVCRKLNIDILEYGEKHPEANVMRLALSWCALAGVGATYHWHIDWNNLSKTGVYETLTQERGVFEMDEYVLDTIGVPYESDEGKALRNHIFDVADLCIGIIRAQNIPNTIRNTDAFLKAMFIYGMVLEMNGLGMR